MISRSTKAAGSGVVVRVEVEGGSTTAVSPPGTGQVGGICRSPTEKKKDGDIFLRE